MVYSAFRDENDVPVATGVNSTDGSLILPFKISPITGRLLTDSASGSGTVTDVSVVSANGFAGTVANSTTAPAITLSTTVNSPVLAGNGTAIAAATTTGTGSTVVLQGTPTLTTPVIGAATGTSLSVTGVLQSATSLILEETGAGTDTITLQAPASIVASYTLTLPINDGGVSEFLQTDGSGVLSWAAGGTGTVTAVSIASANGFAGSSSGGATPALTISTSVTGVLKGNGTAISAATAGSDYAVGSIGLAGGQTIAGSTLTAENLTLRANAADLTTGQVNVSSSKEASNTTTGSVALAGGLAVAKRVYALDMTVTNTITGSVSGNAGTATAVAVGGITGLGTGVATALAVNVGSAGAFVVLDGALGTPSSGTVTNLTGTASININGTVGATTPTTATFTTATINTSLLPDANDGAVLGAAGTAFSDLFLAEGGVINWDSSDLTLTQTGNELVMAGGNFDVGAGNILRLTAGATMALTVPTVDGTATGPTTAAFVSGYTSSAVGDLVYLDVNGKWQKTDADAIGTTTGLLGIALAVAATDAALLVALPGSMVYSTAFITFTIGAPIYVDDATAGAMRLTIPTGADNAVRVVGFGIHADKLFFNPSSDTSTVVA